MKFILTAIFMLVADQLTKQFVTKNMFLGESIPVINNVFHWTYIHNQGAAFGMLEGARWLFVVIALAALGCIWYLRKDIAESPFWTKFGLALFAGGAVGNLIDRVSNGYVIDFFDFRIWPIFNVADIGICVGVALIIWSLIKTEWLNEKN